MGNSIIYSLLWMKELYFFLFVDCDAYSIANGRRPKRRPNHRGERRRRGTQLKTEGNEDGNVFPAIGTALIREKLERFGEWERRFQFCRKNEASISERRWRAVSGREGSSEGEQGNSEEGGG